MKNIVHLIWVAKYVVVDGGGLADQVGGHRRRDVEVRITKQ